MPLTPLHLIPALVIYLLIFPYVDLLALALSVVFIDIEPIANLFIFHSFPLHGLLHSFLGALLIASPALVLICRLLETKSHILVEAFKIIGWSPEVRRVPIRTTVLSVYMGVFTHLVLDFWMHTDISVFYPFGLGNPFQSYTITRRSHTALFIGFIISPLFWFIGKRLHKERPFQLFP